MTRKHSRAEERIIKCLDALSGKESRNIKTITRISDLDDRNYVGMALEVLEGLNVVEAASLKGRDRDYRLTMKGQLFLHMLKGEYKILSDQLCDFLASLDNYTPKVVNARNLASQFLMRSRLESNIADSPYGKLHMLSDAFCLATSALDPDAAEHEIAEDVSTLVTSSSYNLLSDTKRKQDEGRKLLEEAKKILDMAAETKATAKELGLIGKQYALRKIGVNGRGRAIYQVKSSG